MANPDTSLHRRSRRHGSAVLRRLIALSGVLAALPVLFMAMPAAAHGDLGPDENPLAAWPFAPEIIVGLLLAGWIYTAGLRASRRSGDPGRTASHWAFFGGLAALFLALQSPIEVIADHLFVVHQVEHMLLRTVGPMLLMLALPQAVLTRGLSGGLRRNVVMPVVTNGVVRRLFAVLSHPAVATFLFIGITYFWMVPRYHDLAILNEPIHYLWHISLLISGLIFFWRIFDPRPYPLGASLSVRLLMFWGAAMGNILLGAYLSFKSDVLYQAYGVLGRPWDMHALADERFGGLTMWIPGCMMLALSALATLHGWGNREERRAIRHEERGATATVATATIRLGQRSRNRAMAAGLAGFIVFVFALAVSVVLIYDHALAGGHP